MSLGWVGDLDELWANKNLLRCKRNYCGECGGGSKQCLFPSLPKSGRDKVAVGLLSGQDENLHKTKEIREEINHKINVNVAYEVTKFHKGYVFGEPIQYVRRERSKAEEADDAIAAADINSLNGYMALANKPAVDNSLAEWIYVAGVGYRLTLPNPK